MRLSFILIAITFLFKLNAQTFHWAKQMAGPNDDFGYSITTDASGNVYAGGFYESSTITFGATTLTNVSSQVRDLSNQLELPHEQVHPCRDML